MNLFSLSSLINYFRKKREVSLKQSLLSIILNEKKTDESKIKYISKLLGKGIDINSQDRLGYSALHLTSSVKLLNYLLSKNADPNIKNKMGLTPILFTNNIEIAKILEQNGADPMQKLEDGSCGMHHAKNVEMLNFFYEKFQDPNICDYENNTPLITSKFYDVSNELLIKGANVNSQNMFGSSALHKADEYSTMKLLLEYGADPNLVDHIGQTPLQRLLNQGRSFYSKEVRLLKCASITSKILNIIFNDQNLNHEEAEFTICRDYTDMEDTIKKMISYKVNDKIKSSSPDSIENLKNKIDTIEHIPSDITKLVAFHLREELFNTD